MSSAWSGVGGEFLSEGAWAIGQGPGAPDRRVFRALLEHELSAGNRPSLLEVGPGSGIELAGLAAAGLLERLDYHGVDLTPEFVERLRARFPGLDFGVGDVSELGNYVGGYDVVYARHVLEHVPDPYGALAGLFRHAARLAIVSWFIRPTWDEREVGCVEADGFLHQTTSARRMVELANELEAHLYRLDFDHHSTRAAVWVLSRFAYPEIADRLAEAGSSPEFLRSLIAPPRDERERERALVEVAGDVAGQRGRVVVALREAGLYETDEETAEDPAVRAIDRAASAAVSSEPLRRYRRLVLWGFTESLDSMRHVFRHFARAGERLGKEVLRLPDAPDSAAALRASDLVLAVDVEGKHLRYVNDADYVLHNFDAGHPVFEGLPENCLLRLQTYTSEAEQWGVAWDPVRRYDRAGRILFQPWGTDLLADEFLEPARGPAEAGAVFVGAVWDDGGLGNAAAIDELTRVLRERGLALRLHTHVSDERNVEEVRAARIAPAFAGGWQVEKNYLPCRIFKNVSYGQVAVTNVPKFRELLAGCSLAGSSIAETVDEALALSPADHGELVVSQQSIVARYTYRESLEAIARALEEGK